MFKTFRKQQRMISKAEDKTSPDDQKGLELKVQRGECHVIYVLKQNWKMEENAGRTSSGFSAASSASAVNGSL